MKILLLSAILTCSSVASPPNIVLIYADDLGFGDISANGATAVNTPNIDRIAAEGINFKSGYSTTATCTPSRFSLLTGKYAFRQKGTGILPGDAGLIIDPHSPTLATVLQKAGYRTGVVGKWHLGLGGEGGPEWNRQIKPGPKEVGFDFSYIMAATGDRVPCVYVHDGKVVNLDPADPIKVSYQESFPGLPTGISHRSELRMDWSHGHNNAVVNGVGRIGFMSGGKAALWKDEEKAEVFTTQAVNFIKDSKDQPFFLFHALHDIHVPRIPNPRFVGKTKMGARGDAIVQADWQVGEVLKTLDELNLAENTLVIFTSDNGPVLDDGYVDGSATMVGDHKPAGPFRGGKYTIYEGGTRMPFLVRWPAKIKGGKTSEAMVSQVDFSRTFARLAGTVVPKGSFPDSEDVSSALIGESTEGRKFIVEQGGGGLLALRAGNWKLIPKKGKPELFDLARDPAESENVADRHPDKVKQLAEILAGIRG